MSTPTEYFRIPRSYVADLGGIRWSLGRDALETEGGRTVCLPEEIGFFAEGLEERGLPHFGYVVHLLCLLKPGAPTAGVDPKTAEFLRGCFRDSRSSLRNAGAFFSMLLRELPVAPTWTKASSLWRVIDGRIFLPIPLADEPGDVPPLSAAQFEEQVLGAIGSISLKDLHHWFRYGDGPILDPLSQLADWLPADRQIDERSLKDILDSLLESERLQGAVPYVAQFVSALTLPPRKLGSSELPLGGYSDVETRGHPEQILPSQFVLDDLEFLRRFAQNELLYYRREDPRSSIREELLVLLDQGVRSWGRVRHILTAVLLAMGQLAERRGMDFLVATSSDGGVPHRVTEVSEEALEDLLDSSDFGSNPALALEQVLDDEPTVPRDVVLLTHPRNLAEEDVLTASRRVAEPTRLFGVGVDARGSAELFEVCRGSAVLLQSIRVREEALPARPVTAPQRDRWKGWVEEVGFPFFLRLPRINGVRQVVFDADSKHFVIPGKMGMLHLFEVDGTFVEILPRAQVGIHFVSEYRSIVGVRGGFVLFTEVENRSLLIHYDLREKQCMQRDLGTDLLSRRSAFSFTYYPDLHTFVVSDDGRTLAIDLETGRRSSVESDASTPIDDVRAGQAISRYEMGIEPLPVRTSLVVHTSVRLTTTDRPQLYFDGEAGEVTLVSVGESPIRLRPKEDGQPVLIGKRFAHAYLCGPILELAFEDFTKPTHSRWRRLFFRVPEGNHLGGWDDDHPRPLMYSRDGRFLAATLNSGEVEVREAVAGMPVSCRVPTGVAHGIPGVDLGHEWMRLRYGQSFVFLTWTTGILEVDVDGGRRSGFLLERLGEYGLSSAMVRARDSSDPPITIDRRRFTRSVTSGLTVLVDVFGQIAVLDSDGEYLCMFYGDGVGVAGAMPDGTRFGPPDLSLGETPDARARIGRVLQRASRGVKA